MRPKRTFLNDHSKENELLNKPIDQFLKEFLDSQTPNNQSTTKIENLKIFLKKFKFIFKQSSETALSNDRIQFKFELDQNCTKISSLLLINLLQSESNQLTLLSLRLILYLAHFDNFNLQFQNFNINFYIIRLIDLDLSIEETLLSIEYIRLLVQLYPDFITKSIIYCLLSSIEDSKFKLNNLLLETLLEIVCKRPRLACECDVFNELFNFILNVCYENEFSNEIIIQTLIKISDDPECRKLLRFEDLFSQLISPLIDIEYVPLTYGPLYTQHKSQDNNSADNNENTTEPKLENILNSVICSLNVLMKSYNGVMCFSVNEAKVIKSLLAPFSWFLESNRREADKQITLIYSATLTTNSNSTNTPNNQKKDLKDQITQRQMLILNTLVDFFYRLFKFDEISTQDLVEKAYKSSGGRSASVSTTNSTHYQNQLDLIEDDFVNQECDVLFESIDSFSSQSNIKNLALEHKLNIYSTSPNLTICHRVFLLKTFIEAGLFESLLDLYFGLPISFLQNYTLLVKYPNTSSLICQYEILSLKTLNLFAEIYYMANTLLYSEYCIDDFSNSETSFSPYGSNTSVYNEMKKLSLISYLKKLNCLEREKELITFITEFNTRKEMVKNGLQLPTDKLYKLSFYSQQFLANTEYLSSKKFQTELEILNSNSNLTQKGAEETEYSFLEWFKDKSKLKLVELEKLFDEQLEATLILQLDSNLSLIQDQKQIWNWHEIVKLFEVYLLTKSSMHPRFAPTQDALLISSNKKKFLFDNQKFLKIIKKLFEFYVVHEVQSLNSSPNQRNSYSSMTYSINSILLNLISCTGCCLIDFVLEDFNLTNVNAEPNSSRTSTPYEYLFIQFIQHIKTYISTEYYGLKTSSSRGSLVSLINKTVSKDSPLAIYILFLAHLSSSQQGDFLMDNFKLYELIAKIIETHRDLGLMKLVVSTFNYYLSSKSRLLLEKCLCMKSIYSLRSKEIAFSYNDFKLYTLKLILNIFRANNLKFEVYFLNIIFKSLFLFDEQIISIINESNELKSSTEVVFEFSLNLIEYFINLRPDFLDTLIRLNLGDSLIRQVERMLCQNSLIKKSKILSTKINFLIFRLKLSDFYLKQLSREQIESLVDEWYMLKLDHKYYKLIERHLFNSHAINQYYVNELDDRVDYSEDFSSIKEQDFRKNVKLYRRLNDVNKNHTIYMSTQAQMYLPFHVNTAIVRSAHFLEKNFQLSERFDQKICWQLELIKKNSSDLENNMKNLKNLKSALWSISSLCICEDGFKYISKISESKNIFKNLFEFMCIIIKIAEEHSILSIRSTCYLCLNLISKSCTGANLMGKLGWHTFQPNRFTPARAFYSLLSSISNELPDLSFYSSIETAVVLYNINRGKSNIQLKNIKKYFFCELSNYEKEYLNKRNRIDLGNMMDEEFIKLVDVDKIGINFENLSVPIRVSLCGIENTFSGFTTQSLTEPLEVIRNLLVKDKECRIENCFYCIIKTQGILGVKSENASQSSSQIKLEILNDINCLMQVINFDKSKLRKLVEMRKTNPSEFDFCLFYLISCKYLACFKIKFHIRKFIQELFIDIFNSSNF